MTAAGSFTGANAAKLTGSGTKVNSSNKGKLRCLADQVFASGTSLGSGSTLTVGTLPKGAVVIFSRVTPIAATGIATVMTNGVTGVLGVTGDTNLFGAITDMNASAATQVIQPVPDGTIYTGLTPLTEQKTAFITTATAELVAAQGVEVKIFYLVE